jgi:hypothetical protein
MKSRTSKSARLSRSVLGLCVVFTLIGVAPWGHTALGQSRAGATELPFTGETPDLFVAAQKARALRPNAPESDVMAALAVLRKKAPRASAGVAQKAALEIADARQLTAELRGEAALTARALAADEGSAKGVEKSREQGVLTDVSVLGPFRDTGGGVDAHDGPEAAHTREAFVDSKASYRWGTVAVTWRAIPPTFVQAHGMPLDLFVHPRKESCSFVASRITLPADRKIVVRLAAAGSARLSFDGTDVGKSDDLHAHGTFDRLAVVVDATRGSHIVAAKVCAGALDDDGRVRLRLTDESGAAIRVDASADLQDSASGAQPWGKARAKALTTPLARSIRSDGPSPDAALTAAIVRVFAGADDQKSPRAPGQLDAYLQGSKLTADRLAMAAIVSTGAHKSGRLQRALDAPGQDEGVKGFIERQLIEQRLLTDMPDWAYAALRGKKLDTKKDDDATILHARTLTRLHVDALTFRAMHALRGAFEAAPTTVPDALLMELAALTRAHDAKTWQALGVELARRGIRGSILVDAATFRGRSDVIASARDAYNGGVDDATEAIDVARQVASANAHDVAFDLYATLTQWAPNRPEVWSAFAHELSLTDEAGKEENILVALRRARQLAPGNAKVRAEIRLRSKQGSDTSNVEQTTAHEDERWLTPIETILARRKGVPTGGPPDVADRELHWLRAVRMHPDHRVSQLIQYAREIVIAPRTDQELFESLPTEGDVTEIVRARVHRKNGAVAFPTEEHNDGARPRIRWPELEPGDTVEVVVRQWTQKAVGGRGDAPFYFMDYAGAPSTHPLLFNEVVVDTPKDQPLYVDVIHPNLAAFTKKESDEHDRHIVRLVWERPHVVADEPLAPNLSEVAPVIVGSTFQNWAAFRVWYAEAVRGFTEPDEEIRRLAAELTKGKTTREDKLRALFNFVADDIRYVNYVSGEWWLPNRPQQLLARREGDCDDKAMLLMTLLKAIGVDAQEVMVQTRLTGQPSVLSSKNAAVPLFDHGIAFLPGPNGGQFLDATSPQSRLGPIPAMDARAYGLRLDTGPADIVQLPASSPSDHRADVTWNVTLAADGSGAIRGEERHSGDGAFWLRTNLAEEGARAQYVEDALVAPWFPTIEVDRKIAFEGDLPKGEARVSYRATSRGLARKEGAELVLSLAPSNTYGASLAPLPTRTLPVQLPPHMAPNTQHRVTRIVAPAGYEWAPLPRGGDANGGAFGSAHVAFRRDPADKAVVTIERDVVFDQDFIPVEQYAAWRAFVQQIDAVMRREVRLVPVGTSKEKSVQNGRRRARRARREEGATSWL